MLGVRPSLIVLAIGVLGVLAWAGPAAAAGPANAPAPPVVSCAAVEQRLDQAQRAADACEEARQAVAADRAACGDDLSSASQKLTSTQARADACQASKDALCSEAASFAQRLLEGKVTNVGSCVPGPAQARLRQFLDDGENASKALGQLAEFGAGESDQLPTFGGSSSSERLVARLLGPQREPFFYRRLLTEAVRLTAPRAWQQIKSGGPTKVEAWFSSSDPLDGKLVEEAQRVNASAGQRGPSLSAALHLVRAYQLVAQCSEDAPTSACRRARQLQETFESTAPLLLRQRVEDIWAADCRNVSQGTVLAWVQDFPAPQAAGSSGDFSEVARAVQQKLFTCFLGDTEGDAEPSFRTWLDKMLPSPKALDSHSLPRVDDIRAGTRDDMPLDICGRAVRALQRVTPGPRCTALPADATRAIARWAANGPLGDDASVPLRVCARYAEMLWLGQDIEVPGSFARPPAPDAILTLDKRNQDTAFAALRTACEDRHGKPDSFSADLAALTGIARGFGESPEGAPWRADPHTGAPLEAAQFDEAATSGAWLRHILSRDSSCRALGMSDARCEKCATLPRGAYYDCDLNDRLVRRWSRHARTTGASIAAAFALFGFIVWAARMARARRTFAPWSRETRARFAALGLPARPDPLRAVLPSRNDAVGLVLPVDAAWERWGREAVVVRVRDSVKVKEHDVHHAVEVCQRVGARVAFLLHDDPASLDLGAVRAVLDWAGRGGSRAVHVLPLAVSRLEWARTASDLLDLVEETSLRGNPFEVRGRITSSSQFWNRERLVSGLLAETRAGRWVVVTGLRRFGKSSLALEVARRLPGLSAYVDLAGFHHEIAFGKDPSLAVDAILRSVCARLLDSARALYPRVKLQEAPTGEVDAAALTRAVRDLCTACAPFADGRPPPMLLVLDELEQVLAMDASRAGQALDVLAILLGRLRNALGESPSPSGAASVGVLLCGALHPLLWAPLRTLGQQSIMGAFPSLCVPCLSPEAASSMMRGLGGRQGIRFADEALDHIVEQSQGVPLLLRRIGTSVLELYDPDHARQGSLGAVNVGIEGAREAVAREEREGSPLRVWVESEIAEPSGPAGAMLRALAAGGRLKATALREIAERGVLAEFAASGVTQSLTAEEVQRRAQEAGSVLLRLLGETGLLHPVGDPIAPEAYELADGAIRRVLRTRPITA
ncbi:MAG TPA: ATP-binding protein [Polyangiaceae bacterium]|nr:ATP-binding protein [Polyangiaceae bacterium]